MRKRQREHSEAAYQQSRPPQGTEVEWLYFRLIEVFHIEDYDELMEGIGRLFPEMDDDFLQRPSLDELKRLDRRLHGRSWWFLGRVVRERRAGFYPPPPVREMPTLPPDVDYIELELHQILPSLFVVSMDVHLMDSATHHLVQVQNTRHLSEVRFRRLIPWGSLGGGYSSVRAEAVMRRETLRWLTHLQGEVERCLCSYVKGVFVQQPSSKAARFPIVDVHALKGVCVKSNESSEQHAEKSKRAPSLRLFCRFLTALGRVLGWDIARPLPEANQTIEQSSDSGISFLAPWMKSAREWWKSLGFNFLPYSTYTNGKLLFDEGRGGETLGRYDRAGHRLVVLWEPYVKSLNIEMYGSERLAVKSATQDVLAAMLPTLTILELLKLAERNLGRLRKHVFADISSNRLHPLRLGKSVGLMSSTLQMSMLLDRISAEFDQDRAWHQCSMKALKDMRSVNGFGTRDTKGLDEALLEAVDSRLGLLRRHASFIKDWFTQYLALQNLFTTYLLAVIVGIATIVGVIGLQGIRDFLDSLVRFVHNLLVTW
jgi:hypothetical protein